MARAFKQLTYEHRKQMKEMLDKDVPVQIIADTLGFNRATIYREIQRGTENGVYNPEIAEMQKQEVLRAKGREPILSENPELAQRIADYILIDHYSPKQIADIIRNPENKYGDYSITHNTIYNAIDKGLIPNVTRDSLRSDETTVFNNGNIILAKWVREELGIQDGDILHFEVTEDNKVVFYK